MRLTPVVWKQHIDRWFNRHWKLKTKLVPVDMGTDSLMREKGIQLFDPLEVIKEPKPRLEIDVIGLIPKPVPFDESHSLYHSRSCYEYHERSVLIEGFKQAQLLANAVEVKHGLPDRLEKIIESINLQQADNLNEVVQRCVLNSHLLDAYQEKLPKIKDPVRPAFTFPRVYGIADYRRNRLLMERLIELSSSLGYGPQGLVLRNAPIQTFLTNGDKLVKLRVVPGALLCGSKSLTPCANQDSVRTTNETSLPDIFPLHPTISLQATHFYDDREIFPVTQPCGKLQTAIFHFNETQVVNLHEEPVTEHQILGRSLAHIFTVALAEAKHRYGATIPDSNPLPEPVTVQGVQVGGQWLHFSVFQLNSLNPLGPRNIVWSSPILRIFSSCEHKEGIPNISNYNPEAIATFLAFCANGIE